MGSWARTRGGAWRAAHGLGAPPRSRGRSSARRARKGPARGGNVASRTSPTGGTPAWGCSHALDGFEGRPGTSAGAWHGLCSYVCVREIQKYEYLDSDLRTKSPLRPDDGSEGCRPTLSTPTADAVETRARSTAGRPSLTQRGPSPTGGTPPCRIPRPTSTPATACPDLRARRPALPDPTYESHRWDAVERRTSDTRTAGPSRRHTARTGDWTSIRGVESGKPVCGLLGAFPGVGGQGAFFPGFPRGRARLTPRRRGRHLSAC